MTEETVIAITFGMMAGALLGWLAPPAISLAIIAAITFGYYHPPKWISNPLMPYNQTAVATMERRW